MVSQLLALGVTALAPLSRAAPLHYRVEISANQDVDRTAIGLNRGGGEAKAVAFVTVEMSDTVGGQLAHVVIDSMTVDGTGILAEAFDPSVAAAARGVWYHLYLVHGRPSASPTPSVRNPATDLCGRALRVLFSTATPGAGVDARWSDTTTTDASSDTRTSHGSTVESWRVTGVHGDTVSAEAMVIGRRSIEGQVNGTGLASGKRSMAALRNGTVLTAQAQLNEGMLVATTEGAGVVQLRATTTIAATRLP